MNRILTVLVVSLLSVTAEASVAIKGANGNAVNADANNNLNVIQYPNAAGTAAPYERISDREATYGAIVSRTGRLATNSDSIEFFDAMDGSTINALNWLVPVTTMTIAQANGYLTLNNGSSTATSAVARATSNAQFPIIGRWPILVHCRSQVSNLPEANAIAEIGLGNASALTTPTDGVFFRWQSSDATFRAVLNFNSAETVSAVLSSPSLDVGHAFDILIADGEARFYVDQVLQTTMAFPNANANATLLQHQPFFARVWNSAGGSPAQPPVIRIGQVQVLTIGSQAAPWSEQMAKSTRNINSHPQTGVSITAIDHGVSAVTLTSNTSPATTKMGGDVTLPTTAAATTVFPVFSYVTPTGFRAVITGVHISCASFGAATTTTPEIFQWYIATGDTATSLATTDNGTDNTATAARLIPIGQSTFPISTSIGQSANDVDIVFPTPLVSETLKYTHIVLSIPVGTATASELYKCQVAINGFWE